MRQALSKSVLVMAAASGILTAAGGYAFADASAGGAAIGSPGVGSGNVVQVPVHVPVNLCGNTVDVIGLLNPAFGNECANVDGSGDGEGRGSGAQAEAVAANSPGVLSGNVVQAPVDIPVNACGNSVNVVGILNPAFGNKCENVSGTPETPTPPVVHPPHKPPTHHHKPPTTKPPTHHHHPDCPPHHHKPPTHNPPTHKPPTHNPPTHQPPTHHQPPVHHQPPTHHKPVHHQPTHHKPPQLAHTGADAGLGLAGGASAALLLGGGLLVRRARKSQG